MCSGLYFDHSELRERQEYTHRSAKAESRTVDHRPGRYGSRDRSWEYDDERAPALDVWA